MNSASTFPRIRVQRGLAFGVILISALIAFEIFNYSTTEYALSDLLGNLSFLGIHWATILAIAFCGIDFAGIARLHTPEEGAGQPSETWYLFGAWLLAATMNAMLTWWGVTLAITHNPSLGNEVVARGSLLRVVPIFVAVLVWLIRVLIIGTYSLAGTRLLSQRDQRTNANRRGYFANTTNQAQNSRSLGNATNYSNLTSGSRQANQANLPAETTYARQEPTYAPVQSAAPSRTGGSNQNSSGNSSRSNLPRRN